MDCLNTEVPICIKQGATFIWPISYEDASGNAIDLTNYTAAMQIRQTAEDAGTPLVDLTTENGGITIDAIHGLVQVRITAVATALFPVGYVGVYDLFITSLGGIKDVLVSGPVHIIPQVTK